jgi:tetratricopeptide (TPR) repeat protein
MSILHKPRQRRIEMKKIHLLLIPLFLLCACAAQSGKKYILIQEPDKIYEGGKYKYSVDTGDVLKITMQKICPDGMRTCYEVQNINTGEYGFVLKDRMEKRHYIYNESTISQKSDQPDIIVETHEPMTAKGYVNLGNTFLKRGQYSQAIDYYGKAIDKDKNFAMAYANRGIALNKTGQQLKACADWKHACDLGECNMLSIAKKNATCQ